MRLDEFFSRLGTSIIMSLASGDSIDRAIKKSTISALAHQVRKDVDGVPDTVVDVVEGVARELVLTEKIEKEVNEAVEALTGQAEQMTQPYEIEYKVQALNNQNVGISESEALRSVSSMQSGVSESFTKLQSLKATILKRDT